jgi:hypothetical protein
MATAAALISLVVRGLFEPNDPRIFSPGCALNAVDLVAIPVSLSIRRTQ